MRHCSSRLAVFLLVLLLSAPIGFSQTGTPPGEGVSEGDYRIGVGDVLEIQVWKEPDLTRIVPVRPDGKISFPLLDDLQAEGRTPLQLKKNLTEKLKEFLSNPSVTVLVSEINSYKVYVMGEVVAQGEILLKSKTTLLQAISMAGGFTPFAHRNDIMVVRNNGKQDVRIAVRYDRILNGKSPEQNLTLEPGDTIIVP